MNTPEPWTVYRARLGALKRHHPEDVKAIQQVEEELQRAVELQRPGRAADRAVKRMVELIPHLSTEQKTALKTALKGST